MDLIQESNIEGFVNICGFLVNKKEISQMYPYEGGVAVEFRSGGFEHFTKDDQVDD